MARTTIKELKKSRTAALSNDESAAFDATYEAARLALNVGEKVRDARQASGLSQRGLAASQLRGHKPTALRRFASTV